ncbi:MAG: helix-hairpin-helix domain-containing protein [Deltaproteobacteria bacterium]|nr:helix-hairpin-helix domain-containing protein [Deltaproteobacteria bacterium]
MSLLPASDNVSARLGPLSLRQKYLLGKRIDINVATIEEISELPGISDVAARELVEERRRIGRFRSPEELLAVRGIKEKRLKKILPFLTGLPNN